MADPALEPSETLPVIDPELRVVGLERRDAIHARGLWHMAAHLMIFDGRGRLLLQRRSPAKDSWGGYWDISVGGHVGPDETFEQTIARESVEEMGVAVESPRFVRELRPSARTGWEWVKEYVAHVSDAAPKPDPREVSDWTWIAPDELRREIAAARRPTTPVLRDFIAFLATEFSAEACSA